MARQAIDQALLANEKQPLSGDRAAVARRAALLLSRLDPPAAAEVCRRISGTADAVRARGEVAAALAPTNRSGADTLLVEAVALLGNFQSALLRQAELAYLCRQVATFDPPTALRLLHEIKDPDSFLSAWRGIAEVVPLAAAKELPDARYPPDQQARMAQLLLPALAAQDLSAALSLSQKITEPLAKSQALAQLSFTLEPTEALGLAQRISDPSLRLLALRAAAERLAATDPMGALAAISDFPADREAALAAVALAAANQDEQQARGLILGITNPRVRRDTLGLLLIDLSRRNLPAARELLAAHPDLAPWALPPFCGALAAADLPAALAQARGISEPALRDCALAEVARAVAATNPQAAQDALMEVERPALRLAALRALVTGLATTDVERAVSLTTLAADAQEVRLLLFDIARAIAPQDLPRALRMVKGVPASPQRTEALLDLAQLAAPADLKQALEIAGSGLSEAAAAQALAGRLARANPQLALDCANRIIDPLRRAHTFCDIAEILIGGRPGSAPSSVARPEVARLVEGDIPAPAAGGPAPVELIAALPHQLQIRLPNAEPGRYTLRLKSGTQEFVWENLAPAADGALLLRDDAHLRPEQRLRCPSRGSETDPAYFDDFTKADSGRPRPPFGVPVSSFGGAGYLASAPTWLHRDSLGNFWLYQQLRPWRLVSFDAEFNYRFSLVFPTRLLALDSDLQGNLYVLQEGNWLSCFAPDGRPLYHWRLSEGRGLGDVISASGLAVDRLGEYLYLGDREAGRVQRFDLQMRLTPFRFIPWGWLGREDLSNLRLGAYKPESKYRLDRPGRLLLGPDRLLYVDCAYYLMRFDLDTGRQISFGANEVLGWGTTFTDSPNSNLAGVNGHWQEHTLAGIDPQGKIYISDTSNSALRNLRLQLFSFDGQFVVKYDVDSDLRAADGGRVYMVPPLSLAFGRDAAGAERLWLAEGGNRIYEGSLAGGGQFHLGPGAPGKQFDLTLADPAGFTVERQSAWISRQAEGQLFTYAVGRRGTRNCELERNPVIPNGESSIWLPVRLGEPFRVTLTEEGRALPEFHYTVEMEREPGPFGGPDDFFRVTNKSGHTWKNVRFRAETLPPQ